MAVGVFMFFLVAFAMCQSALEFASGPPTLDGGLGSLFVLTLFLVAMAVQAASIALVGWRRGWKFWEELSWRRAAVELVEIAMAVALMPMVAYLGDTIQARFQARKQAESAKVRAEIAQLDQEQRDREAAIQEAADEFVAAVLAGDDANRQLAEAKIAQLNDRIFSRDLEGITSHPNADVRRAFLVFAHQAHIAAAWRFMQQVAIEPNEPSDLRRLALDFLLRPTNSTGRMKFYLGPDNAEVIPSVLEMLNAADAPAEMKIRGIEALARFAVPADMRNQMPQVYQELNHLAQTEQNEAIRKAALEAAAKIAKEKGY